MGAVLRSLKLGLLGRRRSSRLFYPFFLVREHFRPSVPDMVGVRRFRQRSSWGFAPELCPCDQHFAEFLEHEAGSGKLVFHFGTGSHHLVGRAVHRLGRNEVLGVTASIQEHAAYAKLVLAQPELARHYKVLFVDIYMMTGQSLPTLDIAALFHLGEFTPKDRPGDPDAALLETVLGNVRPGGLLAFYPGSFGWTACAGAVDGLVDAGVLHHLIDYKSIRIFRKADAAVGSAQG